MEAFLKRYNLVAVIFVALVFGTLSLNYVFNSFIFEIIFIFLIADVLFLIYTEFGNSAKDENPVTKEKDFAYFKTKKKISIPGHTHDVRKNVEEILKKKFYKVKTEHHKKRYFFLCKRPHLSRFPSILMYGSLLFLLCGLIVQSCFGFQQQKRLKKRECVELKDIRLQLDDLYVMYKDKKIEKCSAKLTITFPDTVVSVRVGKNGFSYRGFHFKNGGLTSEPQKIFLKLKKGKHNSSLWLEYKNRTKIHKENLEIEIASFNPQREMLNLCLYDDDKLIYSEWISKKLSYRDLTIEVAGFLPSLYCLIKIEKKPAHNVITISMIFLTVGIMLSLVKNSPIFVICSPSQKTGMTKLLIGGNVSSRRIKGIMKRAIEKSYFKEEG